MKGKGLLIMIAPSRADRAKLGPAGYKDSMSKNAPDDEDGGGYGEDDGGNDGECTVTLPANVLSSGGEEGGINPGDTIDFDCEAKVSNVQDGKVTLMIKTVNGESVGSGGDIEGENEPDEDDMGGGMGGNTRESTADMGARLRSKAAGIM
jgi:hypothetical protein